MTPDGDSDEILVLRSQLGDRTALEQLVTRWHRPVRDLLFQITLDAEAADDLTQETWVGALRSLARLREPDRFRWWLFTIARRRAHDRFRSAYRRPTTATAPEDLAAIKEPVGYDALAVVDDRDRILDLLGGLDIELREVLALHHLHDWPVGDIAEALDLPAGTVKSRLHRARRRIADGDAAHNDRTTDETRTS